MIETENFAYFAERKIVEGQVIYKKKSAHTNKNFLFFSHSHIHTQSPSFTHSTSRITTKYMLIYNARAMALNIESHANTIQSS